MRSCLWNILLAASVCVTSGTAHCAAAQNITAKDRIALITSARAQYYNLRAAGVKSFHCDIEIDWMSVFTAINGKTPPSDDPMIRYLASTRLGIQDDLAGTPVVEWAASGVPPEGMEKRGDQMRDGFRQIFHWMTLLIG